MRLIHKAAVLLLFVMLLLPLFSTEVEAGNVYTSPYVTFSPDARAWTTNAGDTDYSWYEKGTTVSTGIASSLRALNQGEHYYSCPRTGTIPVGEWRVGYRTGMCIHNDYPSQGSNWHGIPFGRKKCMNYYYSGWIAYCADCGGSIKDMFIYMSREAAESISYLEAGVGLDYYYLCPWCSNLEMGTALEEHKCSAISWNRYKIHYDANTTEAYGGYMADSIHMYNDGTEYDGKAVTALKYLNSNAYSRIGYEFLGWNTMPDGSGTYYADGARIRNLTDENYTMGSAESKGVVTLYAMWKQSSSILQLQLKGGSYKGNSGNVIVERKFGEAYRVEDDKVAAPSGCTVSFQVGGGEFISPITATQHLASWQMELPFQGRFRDGEYVFWAPDGNVDILTACYEPDAVKLPEPRLAGKSFGGWYYEPEFENLAGEAGDFLILQQDVTLYAQWVELKLSSEENYDANDGRGAVDLRWSQPDGKDKVYLVYQRRDGEDYAKIHSAAHIGALEGIDEAFAYTGNQGTYTVPYTGFYLLTAEGAAGGDYGQFSGGRGGRVTARVWLDKGELITYDIGGKDGYHGGGIGSKFANGGGCTIISSDKKGTLLTAGGGGGATLLGNGESGGSALSLRSDLAFMGADGEAGGGAGYVGGNAGEAVLHSHTESCYREMDKDILTEYADYRTAYVYKYDDEGNKREVVQYGDSSKWIPVDGGEKLDIELLQNVTYAHNFGGNNVNDSYLAVYNQDGECLFYRGGFGCEDYYVRFLASYDFDDNDMPHFAGDSLEWGSRNNVCYWIERDADENVISSSTNHTFVPSEDIMGNARIFGGTTYYSGGSLWFGAQARAYKESIEIPIGTTGIYVVSMLEANNRKEHCFYQLSLSGNRKLICGYEEGQIVSVKPAYGGSNYINMENGSDYHSEAGVCEGNGKVEILSKQIGFVDEVGMEGVMAPDLAAPDAVSPDGVIREAVSEGLMRVSWEAPKDNGTGYCHMVKSYLAGAVDWLCQSNITYNVLATGVKGYYCLIDNLPATCVTSKNGRFSERASEDILIGKDMQYLHIAAVDGAGNMGETAHIAINPAKDDIQWKLYTEKLLLEKGDNVYPSAKQDAYYVRSDGKTPFTLQYAAGMEGWPRKDYWLKYAIFEEAALENTAKNILTQGRGEQLGETLYSTEAEPLLDLYPSTAVAWENGESKLKVSQQFILDAGANGREIEVIPVAGADYHGERVYSEYGADRKNGLFLIADGEAPVIHGMEAAQLPALLDRSQGAVSLVLKAEDALSGVADFTLKVVNQDNWVEKTYEPDEKGVIKVDITMDEPIFSGDFTMTAWAVDHVGNERSIMLGTTEFALEAKVKRILEPHEPVFRCGESGILKINAWGYADRLEVEFPEELLSLNPELNRVYEYENLPQYCHEEELQFMIPLDAPENSSLTITVRAYKKDRKLEEYPAVSIIGVQGTILDDIRTRLR